MKKPHYAWAICLACMLLYVCNMGLCSNILTIYLPFIEETGISDSAGSAMLSIRCLFSFLTTFLVDRFYKSFSIRRGLLLISLVGALYPLVACLEGGLITYYIGAALAGIAYGAGCIYPSALLITNWFSTRRGLAVGISSAGSGISTMLFSPALSAVVLRFSLKTAFVLQSAFMLLCAVVVYLTVRDTPEEMYAEKYSKGVELKTKRSSDRFQAPGKGLLAVLALMMLLNGGAGLAFSGHLSILSVSSGYSSELAASAVSIFGLVLIISKLSSGNIADRLGTLKCSIILICIFIAGCFFPLGMNGNDIFWCYALVVLLGFGASVYNLGPPLWAADLSSAEHYGRTLKWLQLFYNLGGIIFTVVPGIIAEHTGEYKSSYLMFAVMMLISLTLLLLAYRRQRKFV